MNIEDERQATQLILKSTRNGSTYFKKFEVKSPKNRLVRPTPSTRTKSLTRLIISLHNDIDLIINKNNTIKKIDKKLIVE